MAVINYLTKVSFDNGAVKTVKDELRLLGIERPLLVTDKGIVACGLLERVLSEAMLSGEVVFDGTPANPTEEAALSALELYVEKQCDGIVAIGGGSSIDLSKAVAILAAHPKPLAQYAVIENGIAKITAATAPVVAIPTTAGTGSEVGRACLITLEDGRKLGLISPHLIPKCAICDPSLTIGLPAYLTAATGMDAIAHCIETFLSPAINPPADAIALDGLTRAIKAIKRAVADGNDLEARWDMMMASTQGALAFQKGLGAVHALSHPLGSLKALGLHHGTLNAVILPAVLDFNQDHVGDKYSRIRLAMGLPESADLSNFILKLNADLGLPKNLKEMGVTDDLIDNMAAQAVLDHSSASNPRVATEQDYKNMLTAAMSN